MAFNWKAMPTWQKGAIVIGGAGAAYLAYRMKQNSAAAAASSTASSTTGVDPVTGLPYSQDNTVDPITGETYLQEAQQYGSVQAAESAVNSAAGYGNGATGGYSGVGYGTPSGDISYYGDTTAPTSYATNAQWAQAVEAGMTNLGYAPTDVAAALGRYLADLSVTSAQATIIQSALAEWGPPPVGQFQIVQAPDTPPTTTGTTTTTTPPPPAQTMTKPATPTGVRATAYTNFIDVGWNAVPGATGYTLHATYQEPASGGSGIYPGTVSGTSGRISGLAPGRTYTIHVAATNAAGTSAETNGPSVKTK